MEKKEFDYRLSEIVRHLQEDAIENESRFENVRTWLDKPMPNAIVYGAQSEYTMESQLMELKVEERKTTFMSDLSIAEWYRVSSVIDTMQRVIKNWVDDEEYIAEFILCVNWKAWEHDARGNHKWASFYSYAYECIVDLIYDYYEGDKEKTSYLWRYLD